LKNHSNWQANAYDTHNSFQIWHVEFHDGTQDLGWADVSVARQLVYSSQAQFDLTDAQRKAVEQAVERFVRANSQIINLVGPIPDHDTSVDYQPDSNLWTLSYQQAGDDLTIAVQFQSGQPFVFTNPIFKGVYFPDVLPFTDWQKQQQSQAVALAFGRPEIAAALRGQDGWTSEASNNDDGTWTVTFKANGQPIASAQVDVDNHAVITFSVTKP
jgi:hypothetical protein